MTNSTYRLPLDDDPEDIKLAFEHFKEATNVSLLDLERHFQLGMACYRLGCYEVAVSAFRMVLGIYPDDAETFDLMKSACTSVGLYDAGVIETCTKIIDHNPKNTSVLTFLGECYHKVGLRDKAIPVLKEAIAIDPRPPSPHLILGKMYAELGDKDSAMEEYKVLSCLDKPRPEILLHFICSRSYLKSNNIATAL